jgi:hypothetical protein
VFSIKKLKKLPRLNERTEEPQTDEKIKLCICTNNLAPFLEDVWGSGGISPPFLTSALDGYEW